MNDTTPELTVHTDEAVASTVTTTRLDDPPPLVVGVYVAPPTTAPEGAVEVNATVCPALPTVNVHEALAGAKVA
nr:hypothetical protein [Actinomycetota bacterium]